MRVPHFDRRAFLGMTAAAVALPGLAAARVNGLSHLDGRAFGTEWRITAAAPDLQALRPGIETLLSAIDAEMSPWRADSVISRVNRGGAGPHGVPEALGHVAGAALRLARDSGGCFDPTTGPLVGRWGFGPIQGERVGDWRDLTAERGRIVKARDGVTLDLCGIAKGWALDRLADLLAQGGIDAALIDLGGELRALGRHPSGRPWQVAVEDPLAPGSAARVLALADRAVATSGFAHQSYRLAGQDYGHIADPRSDQPAATALRSVSVLAPEAMTADGWATALFAAGPMDGPDLARGQGVTALFLTERDGALVETLTGDFAQVLL